MTTCFRVENIVSKYRKIAIKDMEKQNLVYKFRCCCGNWTYKSESGLTLAGRSESHMRQKEDFAFYAHVKHCPSFQKNFKLFLKDNQLEYLPLTMTKNIGRYFEKLKFTKSHHERRFIEKILIKQHSSNLNSQIHIKPLEIFFNRFNLQHNLCLPYNLHFVYKNDPI